MRLEVRILVIATLVAVLSGHALIHGAFPIPRAAPTYALRGGLDPAGRIYQGDNDDGDNDADNDDGDNDADNDDGDNDDRDDDDNENDNDGDGDEDNFDLCSIYEELGIAPPPSLRCSSPIAAPAPPPEPTCSTPGRDAVFISHDGKVALRVFASTPLAVRVVLYQVTNADSAPSPPGTYVRPLVYEVWASSCDADPDRAAEFPAEVNLGIRYSDQEAVGLDEGRFVIGRLDIESATWVPVEKQANDPPANFVSATITETGYYMVWEAR